MFGNLLRKAITAVKPKAAPQTVQRPTALRPTALRQSALPQTPMVGMSTPQGPTNALTNQRVQTPQRIAAPKNTSTPPSKKKTFAEKLKDTVVKKAYAQEAGQTIPTNPDTLRAGDPRNAFIGWLADKGDATATALGRAMPDVELFNTDFNVFENLKGAATPTTGREGVLGASTQGDGSALWDNDEELMSRVPDNWMDQFKLQADTTLFNRNNSGGNASGNTGGGGGGNTGGGGGGNTGGGGLGTGGNASNNISDPYTQMGEDYMLGAAQDKSNVDASSQLALDQINNDTQNILQNYELMTEQERLDADGALAELGVARQELEERTALSEEATRKNYSTAVEDTENYYGSAVRKRAKENQLRSNQMRNMFSALGTAESSQFMEQMGQLEQGVQGDINNLWGMQAKDISGLRGSEADRLSEIGRDKDYGMGELKRGEQKVIEDRDLKLRQIAQDGNATAAQKDLASRQVHLEAMNILSSIDKDTRAYTGQLPILRQEAALQERLANAQMAAAGGGGGSSDMNKYLEALKAMEGGNAGGGGGQPFGTASLAPAEARRMGLDSSQQYVMYSDGTVRDQRGNIVNQGMGIQSRGLDAYRTLTNR